MESAKDIGPNLVMIILDQKKNIKRLYKMLLLRPCGINVMKYCIMNTKRTRENIVFNNLLQPLLREYQGNNLLISVRNQKSEDI